MESDVFTGTTVIWMPIEWRPFDVIAEIYKPKEPTMQNSKLSAALAIATMATLGANAFPGGRGIPDDSDRPPLTDDELKAMDAAAEARRRDKLAEAEAKRRRKCERRLQRGG